MTGELFLTVFALEVYLIGAVLHGEAGEYRLSAADTVAVRAGQHPIDAIR
jgi:hypothetical protein